MAKVFLVFVYFSKNKLSGMPIIKTKWTSAINQIVVQIGFFSDY